MTKNDIVEAAFKVWGRNFYLDTSLSSVARELGVSKAALYRHFDNKQALLDAMHETFFDAYSGFVRADYEKAIAASDRIKGYFILMRTILRFYANNPGAFLFSLVQAHNDRVAINFSGQLLKRNIDMRLFSSPVKTPGYPSLIQLIAGTQIFFMGQFYERQKGKAASEKSIQDLISLIETKIKSGLGFSREVIDTLDYGELENSVPDILAEPDRKSLHSAVAAAVAEAGPWNVSMDMVARRSGLSKSGLYSHYRNKQDMIAKFFITEFERIIQFSEKDTNDAGTPEARLYLTIISIAAYFRSRPEILKAINWLRAKQMEWERSISFRADWVLPDFKSKKEWMAGKERALKADHMIRWVFFLIINTFMRKPEGTDFCEVPNESFRIVHRFVSLGLEGFNK